MRVAIVVDSGTWGGLESHAVGLAQALEEAGDSAVIVCVGKHTADLFQRMIGGRVEMTTVPSDPKRPAGVRQWRARLRDIVADGAILEKGTLHTANLALDLALRWRFGRRFIAIQQLEPPPLPRRVSRRFLGLPGPALWWHRMRWRGYARSIFPTKTVCVSDAVRDALADQYLFRRQDLVTVRHGIDPSVFKPDADLKRETRRAWGIPETAHVFGSIRRLIFDKGLDTVIAAFAQTRAAQPGRPMYLAIVGEGPERTALEAEAESLGVRNEVKFVGFTSEPWKAYPAIDVFLLPSRVEALGVVALEALASGCRVIGSLVGGIPEMIGSPDIGTLVPAGDAAAWATAMTSMLGADSPGEVERRRAYVAEHFDLHQQYKKIADLLRGHL